ncbi:glycoside hydrolase family 73 protein [Enterococcus hermanniensis]|uniref:Mannosyl-glycoprotein endo-beta-N-acetylglucosamidase-like domain-containing protein n=1 Tax=Enterococcus hermanniensis TaxID=249189 RepID=A0A1L8TQI3_9ENTE|nr:glycoside hydrolase family 73 protein [Enterococcus hermanniensis]OJG46540.1 hypothetical protein RV04_GL000968 [Enterococcus hermanniensis]
MKYRNLFYGMMILSGFSVTTVVAQGETADASNSNSLVTSQAVSDSDNNEDAATGTSEEIDKVEYDANGNLQFYHPTRFEDFTIELPALRAARSTITTQQAFIDQVAPSAKSLASANNLYASVMIAQAIVESGWGSSSLSQSPNYNLFGIKGTYNGQSVTLQTQEWSSEKGWYYINAQFRKYPSYKESLADNVAVLKNTSFQTGVYYYAGAWKSNTKSYKDATAYLTGRYATAPTYASTLNSIIETYNLTQYDTTSSNSVTVKTNAMYRLYNPNSGEHFYTANTTERDTVKKAGWKYEGIGWQAPTSGTPVYRLYNPNAGDHHYTTYAYEKENLVKAGWKYEGVSWYSGGSQPLYRLYNPNAKAGSHHYTLLQSERDNLIKVGWKYEGIGWYGQ